MRSIIILCRYILDNMIKDILPIHCTAGTLTCTGDDDVPVPDNMKVRNRRLDSEMQLNSNSQLYHLQLSLNTMHEIIVR